jgi:hypothetical protein
MMTDCIWAKTAADIRLGLQMEVNFRLPFISAQFDSAEAIVYKMSSVKNVNQTIIYVLELFMCRDPFKIYRLQCGPFLQESTVRGPSQLHICEWAGLICRYQ